MNTKKKIRNSLLLVLTAIIWGVAFVAQSTGGDEVGPYAFNSIRSIIGGTVLLPVIFFLDKTNLSNRKPKTKQEKKTLLIGGVCCGTALFFGSTLQQVGIYFGAGAGRAGFLTACYIILVPILSLFLKKKCGWNIWLGVSITLVGLYLLCIDGTFLIQAQDILLLISALTFAIHILVIDKFSPLVDGVRLSCIQFFTSGLLCAIPTFFIDMKHSMSGFDELILSLQSWDAWIPILYAGVLSCGVAYTLQIIGQNGLNPTVASLIMSLESVFSVIAGWLLLKESMSGRELIGCLLIFVAIILAQIPIGKRNGR